LFLQKSTALYTGHLNIVAIRTAMLACAHSFFRNYPGKVTKAQITLNFSGAQVKDWYIHGQLN
jgi:hypothetical protein